MSTISTYYKGDCHFESVPGNHKITVDMPEFMGGKDRGSTPPQLFSTSLSSCAGVPVSDFCHKHDLYPGGLEVHALHEMGNQSNG